MEHRVRSPLLYTLMPSFAGSRSWSRHISLATSGTVSTSHRKFSWSPILLVVASVWTLASFSRRSFRPSGPVLGVRLIGGKLGWRRDSAADRDGNLLKRGTKIKAWEKKNSWDNDMGGRKKLRTWTFLVRESFSGPLRLGSRRNKIPYGLQGSRILAQRPWWGSIILGSSTMGNKEGGRGLGFSTDRSYVNNSVDFKTLDVLAL